jgi:hypothetical protein
MSAGAAPWANVDVPFDNRGCPFSSKRLIKKGQSSLRPWGKWRWSPSNLSGKFSGELLVGNFGPDGGFPRLRP